MLYLLIAIVSNALVSLTMRFGEGRFRNRMGMLMTNYVVCSSLGFFFWKTGENASISGEKGLAFAILFGAVTGVAYLLCLTLLQRNIKSNGVVLAATFMKMGVLVPTLAAVTVFGEKPRAIQILGFAIAVGAILLISGKKDSKQKANKKALLLLLLVISGTANTMVNVFDKWGVRAYKDLFLFCIFAMACLCACFLWLRDEKHLCGWDLAIGAVLGIPNYFASRFLLHALRQVPAVITYPMYSAGTLVVITLVGVFCFKEKLDKRKTGALTLILLSLVLLNL